MVRLFTCSLIDGVGEAVAEHRTRGSAVEVEMLQRWGFLVLGVRFVAKEGARDL